MNRFNIRGLVLVSAIGSLLAAAAALPIGFPGIIAAVIGIPLMAYALWTGRQWFLITGLATVLLLRVVGELLSPSGAFALVAGLAAYLSAELARWSFAARGFTQFAPAVVHRAFADTALVVVGSTVAGIAALVLTTDRIWPSFVLPVGAITGPIAIAILTVIVVRRTDRPTLGP